MRAVAKTGLSRRLPSGGERWQALRRKKEARRELLAYAAKEVGAALGLPAVVVHGEVRVEYDPTQLERIEETLRRLVRGGFLMVQKGLAGGLLWSPGWVKAWRKGVTVVIVVREDDLADVVAMPHEPGRWWVRSRTETGARYVVEQDGAEWNCTCDGHLLGGHECRHIQAVKSKTTDHGPRTTDHD